MMHAWAHDLTRRYVQAKTERRPYPSGLPDACWELTEPVLRRRFLWCDRSLSRT
ncbi:predicted protein [Streptomyces viridosporus ATCC 14672]|uniref:Predicted protein n=1 Tax=Streptomyces viridosporus (strain ATCC 14672 / DSM 40746 / JCM 4963 / KCTC 9882 / NRRL B-12104 / FH 1290) TaxID=566461 RepID=D6A8G1_STRV1|nr:predicted protein [Streptomyces viridosporus ATCC 14672]